MIRPAADRRHTTYTDLGLTAEHLAKNVLQRFAILGSISAKQSVSLPEAALQMEDFAAAIVCLKNCTFVVDADHAHLTTVHKSRHKAFGLTEALRPSPPID
ncbi:MAG: hypothetical protein F4060_09380 [Holophagales bacterium]|nr:hypothetical protein [Holophagales bacterium]MYG31019.1 hypothetical protein [Holophagales bacterium]MYI80143.1 hypothetical protein [Holophagales bacterium]